MGNQKYHSQSKDVYQLFGLWKLFIFAELPQTQKSAISKGLSEVLGYVLLCTDMNENTRDGCLNCVFILDIHSSFDMNMSVDSR